ncbi:hypothetical protein [Acinetobacter baumannii]|uniref:hypothetical protein n=1 Tax=Acinetobacter baumannii TaxID=470 RepID=UPI0037BF87ED|nr:hypothetical protein [Acinetobacter baumannii]
MDLCSLNLNELFKVVTPFIIALVVYNFWHRQKSKEVLANEFKELLKNILEEAYLSSMLKIENQTSLDVIKEKIERLETLNQIIFRNSLFIQVCINDTKVDNVLKNYTTNSKVLISILKRKLFKCSGPFNYKESLISHEEDFDKYTNSVDDIIDVIAPYSLYKKKFKIHNF